MPHKNRFNFYILISLYMIILFGTGCTDKKSKELTLPIDSIRLIQPKGYYTNINNNVTVLKLADEYKNQTKQFTQQELKIPVKGYNFGSNYVGNNNLYYELGWFEYENNIYKMIVYNKVGEADTPLLNVQLNSYDKSESLVDALLLSSFFSYEGMDCFSSFIIYPDHKINIDNYVKYKNEDNLSEKLIAKPLPQIYLKESYKITKGRFELISRSEK